MKDCADLAQRLVTDEPALLSSLDFGAFVAQGAGYGPSLLIGDQSEITLQAGRIRRRLDYRMSHLARPGDTVLVRARDPDFEAYLAEYAGLEDVTFVEMAPPPALSVAKHALTHPTLIDRFAQIAVQNGGLALNAYLTTGNIWRLAQAIGQSAQQVVHVCGPSPRVSTRCNDKLWFTRLARAVLGRNSTPPTMSAYGPAATAALVQRMSKIAAQVIVKVPDSAGSAGNVRLSSALVSDKPLAEVRALLLHRLRATGWQDQYPVLVGVWDDNVTSSPSVQLWIPQAGTGQPNAQAVFEQSVMGDRGAFVGATRSSLPDAVLRQLIEEAEQIATVLQNVGYFGRCSFDAVMCAGQNGDRKIHWIECNGRWGGVSIPMTAVAQSNSLRAFPGLVIIQELLPDTTLTTAEMLKRLEGLLFCHSRPSDGIILLSPPTAASGAVVNFMALSTSQAAAQQLGDQAMRRLRSSA